jgi:hypothetical protein
LLKLRQASYVNGALYVLAGRLLLSDFNESRIFPTDFRHSAVKFHENSPSGSGVVPDGRTDGETHMTKLMVAFCGFTSARKMGVPLKIAPYFALGLFCNFDQRWQGKVYYIYYKASVRSYSFFVSHSVS